MLGSAWPISMLTWPIAHFPCLVWFPRLPTALFIVIVCVMHPHKHCIAECQLSTLYPAMRLGRSGGLLNTYAWMIVIIYACVSLQSVSDHVREQVWHDQSIH